MTESKPRNKRADLIRLLIHLALMMVTFIIILMLVFRWLNIYTRHGKYIEVPSVTGLSQEEAESILTAGKLKAEVSDFQFDRNMEAGAVIRQQPEAGAHVKDGRTIYLTLNSGKEPMRTVPDLADNSSLRAAESRLRIEGFRLTEPVRIDGDLDWVYEIRYGDSTVKAGTELPEGSLLTIVVGNGNEVEQEEETDSTMIIEYDFFGDGL